MDKPIKVTTYLLSVHALLLSHVRLFVTPWTLAHQDPLSMGFPRQEYWSELPFPSPGDLPDPGIKPVSPSQQVYSLPLSHQVSPVYLENISSVPISLLVTMLHSGRKMKLILLLLLKWENVKWKNSKMV